LSEGDFVRACTFEWRWFRPGQHIWVKVISSGPAHLSEGDFVQACTFEWRGFRPGQHIWVKGILSVSAHLSEGDFVRACTFEWRGFCQGDFNYLLNIVCAAENLIWQFLILTTCHVTVINCFITMVYITRPKTYYLDANTKKICQRDIDSFCLVEGINRLFHRYVMMLKIIILVIIPYRKEKIIISLSIVCFRVIIFFPK